MIEIILIFGFIAIYNVLDAIHYELKEANHLKDQELRDRMKI